MKSPSLRSITGLTLLSALFFTSCKEDKPALTPEQQEQEVERRVQQKLNEERLAQQQQALDQKAQDLTAREQQLAQREQSATPPPATPEPTADREPRRESAKAQESPEAVALRGIVVAEPATSRPPGSYDVFYNALDRYGDWFEVPSYGLVWRPSAAVGDPGWRPYALGHLAYTEQGWTWISDEPFGWATYHYGRWTRLVGAGWIWVPGDQWAPAWVSWRNNDNYVGWAPLPPESSARVTIREGVDSDYNIAPAFYSFVDLASFGDRDLAPRLVAPEQNVTIINQTQNVTNLYVNNTVVINQGPSIEVVQRHSHRHIDILKIARKSILPRGEAHEIRGDVLEIQAPLIEHGRESHHRPIPQHRVEVASVDRSTPPPARLVDRPPTSHPQPNQPVRGAVSPQPQSVASATPAPAHSFGSPRPQRPTALATPQVAPSPAQTAPQISPTPARPAATPWVTSTPWPARTAPPASAAQSANKQPAATFTPQPQRTSPSPRPSAVPVRPVATPWATPTPWPTPTTAPTSAASRRGERPVINSTPQRLTNQPATPSRPAATPWNQPVQATTSEVQPQQIQRIPRPTPTVQRFVQPEPRRQVEPQPTLRPEPPRRPEIPVSRPAEPARRIEPAHTTVPSPSAQTDDDKDQRDKKHKNR